MPSAEPTRLRVVRRSAGGKISPARRRPPGSRLATGQREPEQAGDALVRLAELRWRQGKLDEAERLFARFEGHSRAVLGRAALALDTGRLEEAADLAERYLRRFPNPRRLERSPGLEVAVRAYARLDRLDRAHEALAQLREISSRASTRPLEAASMASEGAVAAVESHRRARAVSRSCAVR